MLNENTLTELLSVLKATLNKLGATETQITKIQNSAIIDGNGSAIFQGIHNSPINISLALSDPQVLATLAQQILQQSQSPKPPHHIGDQWQPNTIFFGRTQDMETITEQLRTSKALLLLNGIGGMGKTALANQLRYQIGDQYDHVIWTNLQNAADTDEQPLRNHLLYNSIQLHQDLGIGDVLRSEQDETQKWAIIVRALKQLGSNVLWIIDNAHQQDQSTIKALPDNCHILLTSRHAIGDISTHYVDELDMVAALRLFKYYYHRPDDDQIILDVCGAVGYHALSVELLAKTLNELPNKGASFLLQEFKKRGIGKQTTQAASTDIAAQQTRISHIFEAILQIGNLHRNIPALSVLRIFMYLPCQDILFQLIALLAQKHDPKQQDVLQNSLNELARLGWLRHTSLTAAEKTTEFWQMQPAVQEWLWQKLPKNPKQEKHIFRAITKQAIQDYEDNAKEAQIWKPFLNALIKYHSQQDEQLVLIYNSLADLNDKMGYYAIALQQRQAALSIALTVLPAQHPDLAALYSEIALTYASLNQYDTALVYYEHCRAIQEQILSPQHPDLAQLYGDMADAYSDLKQYDTALTYYERSRAIFEPIQSTYKVYLAKLYMKMALAYHHLTQYETALTYYERCWTILEQAQPTSKISFATLYMNIANAYRELNQYDTALAYYEQSRLIWEQILATQHPNFALILKNISILYIHQSQFQKAKTYIDQSVALYQQTLPPEHLYLQQALELQNHISQNLANK
ncbi:MAG TPA: tetratricopeptide repeat protein [Chitinophagales bacterium]|nr:tetratricopeptide repeat protein [Chitinophagales bacterium]